MIYVSVCTFISTVHASSLCFLGFFGSVELSHFQLSKVSLFLLLFSFLIQDDQTSS